MQAQIAGCEGQEGVSGQTRGLGTPGGFQLGALVGREESEGGVAFAWVGGLVRNAGR